MVQIRTCINVYSDLNPWIDFVIITDDSEDIKTAEEIVQKAEDDWWKDKEDEPIAEYIGRRLYENGIEFEVYFKDEQDD